MEFVQCSPHQEFAIGSNSAAGVCTSELCSVRTATDGSHMWRFARIIYRGRAITQSFLINGRSALPRDRRVQAVLLDRTLRTRQYTWLVAWRFVFHINNEHFQRHNSIRPTYRVPVSGNNGAVVAVRFTLAVVGLHHRLPQYSSSRSSRSSIRYSGSSQTQRIRPKVITAKPYFNPSLPRVPKWGQF